MTGRDRGFTLIELVIAMALSGIVATAAVGSISVILLNRGDTTGRAYESSDVQLATAYWADDVQSLGVRDWTDPSRPFKQSVELGAAPTAGLYPCGPASLPNAVVRLAWNDSFDTSLNPVEKRVVAAYVVEAAAGGTRQLHRVLCSGGTAVTSDVTLVRSLDASAPTVSCQPASCEAATPPQTAAISLTITDPQGKTAPVTITLNGQRRQS